MLIDWFTILAQAINFLILIFLLKRVLYGPIIAAMEAREQRVLAHLEQAREQQAAAEQAAADYRRKSADLDREQARLLDEAAAQADTQRQELEAAARTELEQRRTAWHAALEQHQAAFLRDLQRRTSEQVLAIARRVLADLADADLEQQLIAAFIHRLRELEPATQAEIRAAFAEPSQPVLITSAFALSGDQRRQLRDALYAQFGDDAPLAFAANPELIGGVSLTAGSREIAWSVQSYLEDLEAAIVAQFAEHGAATASPAVDLPAARAVPGAAR